VPANPVIELRSAPSAAAGTPNVVPYDFRRPTMLSRDHARLLQLTGETFARRLTTLLTSGLRQICRVTLEDVSQQSYDEYVAALPTPTLILPVSLPPLVGTATLQFSLPVALAAIDHMLGGPGGTQQPRTLTDVETSLLGGLIEQILGVLRYALEPLVIVKPTAGTIEYNPPFLQAAGPSDAVVVADFDMAIGEESCRLSISLPLASLQPRLDAQRPKESRAASEVSVGVMRETLADVPVEVSVAFAPIALDSARILSLDVGDVVLLDHRVGAPLHVQSGDSRIAHAVAGKSGNRLAALVVDRAPSPAAPTSTKEFA
jgi:flagellar motor switch protein FliM